MSVTDEIKQKSDIVEIIGASGVNLRKTGRSFVGFCPFHPNTRTPAFTVYPDTQSFYCFGCHASGTVFDYVMRKQGLDFKQALEQLAARAGVRLEPKDDQQRQEDARRTKLLEINAAAAKYFNYVLLSLARGQAGRDYVEKRAISPAMVEAFQLGFSLDDWGHLFHYLTERKGYTPDEVAAAGLAVRRQSNSSNESSESDVRTQHAASFYDRFRGRLIFPIRNARGEVVGFGGRALGDAQPKYLNTPETLLFKKGDQLYGLDLARDAIRSEDRTIVVEGYVDVITAHQHGFRNVVAPLGTALTRSHVALLKRLSHHVYLALDADAAGQKATLRGLSAIRESVEEEGEGRLVATAQGAVRLESEVALRIITMPEGRDPDEVIKADPELWRTLVAGAVPVMEFYLNAYTAGLDFRRPEDQRTALDRLVPLLQELNTTSQSAYATRLEQILGMKAELIMGLLSNRQLRQWRKDLARQIPAAPPEPGERKQRPVPAPVQKELAKQSGNLRPHGTNEAFLLALALRHPTVDAAVEALLERDLAICPAIRPIFGGGLEDLLLDPQHLAIWRAYSDLPPEARPATPDELTTWVAGLDETLRERAGDLLRQAPRRPDDFRYRQEAEQCARLLRLDQVAQMLRRLNERSREVTEPDELDEISRTQTQILLYRAEIQRPRRSSTYTDVRNTLGRE